MHRKYNRKTTLQATKCMGSSPMAWELKLRAFLDVLKKAVAHAMI